MSFFDNFKTYNDSHQNAFEALCNQLFERFIRCEHTNELKYFTVVNGAGGDGGVEAYAELKSGSVIGVQSKWFRTSLSNNQIAQIKKSILTAKKVRKGLEKYIICVPRDFQSSKVTKGKKITKSTEEKRINDLKSEIAVQHPDLELVFWNEYTIRKEAQKPGNEGVYRFWFEKEQLSIEFLQLKFNLAKEGWLRERYSPEMHSQGFIHEKVNEVLFTEESREEKLLSIGELLSQIASAESVIREFIAKAGESNEFQNGLNLVLNKLKLYNKELMNLDKALCNCDLTFQPASINELELASLIDEIEKSKFPNTFRNIRVRLVSNLKRVNSLGLNSAIHKIILGLRPHSLVIHGEPGTGKTHGVAKVVQERLKSRMPAIIIRAKNTPNDSWASILHNSLSGLNGWSDSEIFTGLESLATLSNQQRKKAKKSKILIEPTQVLVCVDGIDEANDFKNWKDRINESKRWIQDYPRLKFVFTIRHYIPYNPNPCGLDFDERIRSHDLPKEGDVPINELAIQYLDGNNIDFEEVPWIVESFENALSLKLFCEKYRGLDLQRQNNPVRTSLAHLLNTKIKRIEDEFYESHSPVWSTTDNVVKRSLFIVTEFLRNRDFVIHDDLCNQLTTELNGLIDRSWSAKLVDTFSNHAVIYKLEQEVDDELSLPVIKYTSSYQSYSDYFIALKATKLIVETGIRNLPEILNDWNSIRLAAILLLNDHNVLVGENGCWTSNLSSLELDALKFQTLCNASDEVIKNYLPLVRNDFFASARKRNVILSEFLIPSLNRKKLNLGIEFLHNTLVDFVSVYERDLVWSSNEGFKIEASQEIGLLLAHLTLHDYHRYNELPILIAWSLSSTNNVYREKARSELTMWGGTNLLEFVKLLDCVFFNDDPQIQEDLSIVCLGIASITSQPNKGMKELASWISKNIFTNKRIIHLNNAIIRHGMRIAMERAYSLGECNDSDITNARPPYKATRYLLDLDVLEGNFFQSGRFPIVHDLAWYVIKKSFEGFLVYKSPRKTTSTDWFLKKYERKYKTKLNPFDFALSAGIAYIQKLGFTKEKGFGMTEATHGSKSKNASIGEKYTWLAVHEIKGFLADRMAYIDNHDSLPRLQDYAHIVSVLNPTKDSWNEYKVKPIKDAWYVPEEISPSISLNTDTFFEDVSNWIEQDLDPSINLWININDLKLIDAENSTTKEWITLYADTDLSESNNIGRTALELRCCMISRDHFDDFQKFCNNSRNLRNYPFDHTDSFKARPAGSVYSSVKDIVWMNWLEEDSSEIEFEHEEDGYLTIYNSFTEVIENSIEEGEAYFKTPSKLVRKMMNLISTDKDRFYDERSRVKALFSKHGQSYYDSQELLIVDREEFYRVLDKNDLKPFWIAFQHRTTTLECRREHDTFHAEKNKYWIVWFEEDVIRKIPFNEYFFNNASEQE